MVERRQCEFFLVRYVPDPVKNEFVNIGALLRGPGGELSVRFTRDWRRVRCVDPDADVDTFEALELEWRRRLPEKAEGYKPLLELLEDSLSAQLQIAPPQGYEAENLVAGLDKLMSLYVEPRKRETAGARLNGRQAVLRSMRTHFERAGVWDLMRKRIAAAQYTKPGDPLRIDCGYRTNGDIRMFHAVSLDGDLEMAKSLAFSASVLDAGVMNVEGAKLALRAVVEPLGAWDEEKGRRASPRGGGETGDERQALYRFGKEIMEEHSILVITTADLPRFADAARLELRV